MAYTRREFGKLALAGLPAAAVLGSSESIFGPPSRLFAATAGQAPAAKPNSNFGGVQIGTITYSYRQMQDQSAEATLKYLIDSGLSACELMDGPAESFAGRPAGPARGGFPGGGAGGGGRRGEAGPPPAPQPGPGEKLGEWHGAQCVVGADGQVVPPGRAGGAGGFGGGGRARGNQELTPEQQAAQAAQREAADKLKAWRTSVSMDKFKALRKMYNDAGVTIYAYKSDGLQKNINTSQEELEYVFNVAAALGATHTTMELPAGPDAEAMLKRMAALAEKHKVAIAYHSHLQGSMTAFDQALAVSKWSMSNVDLGHFVAGGNKGGTPLDFLNKFHDRIASVHLKDRTLPEHCSLNLAWGAGETPLKDILLAMKKNKWKFPGSIEFEYAIPDGSDPVKEVRKSVEYCRAVLTS